MLESTFEMPKSPILSMFLFLFIMTFCVFRSRWRMFSRCTCSMATRSCTKNRRTCWEGEEEGERGKGGGKMRRKGREREKREEGGKVNEDEERRGSDQ